MLKQKIEDLIKVIDKEIDKQYQEYPLTIYDNIRKNAYCHALSKVLATLQDILSDEEETNENIEDENEKG